MERKRKNPKKTAIRVLICIAALAAVVLFFFLLEKVVDASGAVEKAQAKQAADEAKVTEAAVTEAATELTEAVFGTESTEETSETETEQLTTSLALQNPQLDISAYDPTLVEWGSGGPTDAYGRPDGCTLYQQKYGDLSAYFIMPWEEGEPKVVYLTFDIGYTNEYTLDILDTLKEKEVPGVFFATLAVVEDEPEIVNRILTEGHELGNHSITHTNMAAKSVEEQTNEVMAVHNAALENYGYTMHLWRYPEGKFSEQGLAIVNNCNYRSVFWSFAHRDWVVEDQPDVNEARTKAINALHPGAIYLLHGISSTNAAILGDLIDAGREQGYTFELLQ